MRFPSSKPIANISDTSPYKIDWSILIYNLTPSLKASYGAWIVQISISKWFISGKMKWLPSFMEIWNRKNMLLKYWWVKYTFLSYIQILIFYNQILPPPPIQLLILKILEMVSWIKYWKKPDSKQRYKLGYHQKIFRISLQLRYLISMNSSTSMMMICTF